VEASAGVLRIACPRPPGLESLPLSDASKEPIVSTLTKLFIGLHVVLSMLLAAGIVVFVNKTEAFRTDNDSLKKQLAQAKHESESARTENTATAANAALAVQAANNESAAKQAQLDNLNRQLLDAKGQVAQANAQVSTQQASMNAAQAALAAAQANQGALQAQQIEIRKANDEAQRKLVDANIALTDATNRVQVLERQVRTQAEELAALQEDRGGAAATAPGARSAAQSTDLATTASDTGLNINGVVRATQTIAGIKYATISVGSADAVRKGTRFRVLGGANGNQFLGFLTVTSVEPHESVGRLEGPGVAAVTRENLVRTRF